MLKTPPRMCDRRGCDRPADPEIVLILANQKVVQFCCEECLRAWGGLEDKSGKTDARMY